MFIGTIKGFTQNNKPYELEIAETGEASTLYIGGQPTPFDKAHAYFSYNQNNWLLINGNKYSITDASLNCSDITFMFGGFNQELLFKNEQFLHVESFDLFADMKAETYILLKLLLGSTVS